MQHGEYPEMPWKNPEEIIAADGRPVTLEDTVAVMAATLQRLADVITPGVRGIPGAQEIPELRIRRQTVGTVPALIPGNQLRKSLTLHNVGANTVYVTTAATDAYTVGFPMHTGDVLNIEARANIWVCTDAGASELATIEEAS